MRCYFLRGGRIAGVDVFPAGLSDEDAIARARTLASKRRGPFDSFELWEGARFVFRDISSAERPQADQPQASSPDDG